MNLQTSLTFLGKPERFESFQSLLPSGFKFVYIFEHDTFPRVFICKSDSSSFLSICYSSSKKFLFLPLRKSHIKILRARRPIKDVINSISNFFLVDVYENNEIKISYTSTKPSTCYENYAIDFENVI